MPDKIIAEYKKAQSISKFGSRIMYVLAMMCMLITVISYGAIFGSGATGISDWQIISLFGSLATIVSISQVASFLSHFSKGINPFSKTQSNRLILAGVAILLRLAFDSISQVPSFIIEVEGAHSFVQVTSQPGPDLKVVVMVVFLVCLAMVVRYGDALKEDSDAFV